MDTCNDFTNYGIVGQANAATIMVGQHVHAVIGQAHPTDSQALVEMGQIDSFRGALEVPAEQVAGFANSLVLPERVVKQLLARLLGEPFVPNDWGGEHDDLYTTRVTFRGQPTPTSFLLKGAGLKGMLTPARLGKNGDQLTRMLRQPADLFIVQHVGAVSAAVRQQLQEAVVARRVHGHTVAVGSVWDGSDTARLFVAHGYIEPHTGKVRPGVLED
jgi:hypothetical protein